MLVADKRRAREQAWRISESGLHLTELLGGWPGAFLAQRRLRHKVSKPGFQVLFWLIVLAYQFVAFDSLQNWQFSRAAWDYLGRTARRTEASPPGAFRDRTCWVCFPSSFCHALAMPVPIITVSQMRQWEQLTWASGQTEERVIAQVGAQIARRALQLTHSGDRVLILAGKGHNGDDARLAAPHLASREVELLNVFDPTAVREDLARLLQQRPRLVIDGLFGIGLNRPLDAGWGSLIEAVNSVGLRVLAVDNPSGLNVETGQAEGATIRASITLTLGAAKRGLFAPPALPFVGRLEVAPDIGLVPCPFKEEWLWTLPEDFADFPPSRPVAGHKGTFGHLAIVAGSQGYHGAAVLAARGAQRARPGLITLFTQPEVYVPVASQLQAVMVRTFEAGAGFDDYTAILIGPGLASPQMPAALRSLAARLWTDAEVPLIVDASALDWLPLDGPAPRDSLRVITPHPGEAARLLQTSVPEVQSDRVQAVRRLSERLGGAWVVLKGHQTLVGRATGEVFVNPTGNPDLAQGGSGDVLAGYLAGWLAQPLMRTEASTAIRHAVWQHGAAADALSAERDNWVVEELVERLRLASLGGNPVSPTG
jgi:ADP-dependent NAD(P)H-hydrate dehydratase / NAD(P)H-hydrate epimerase